MAYLDTTPLIAAEGIVWPLETFLDSHGFERRPEVVECRTRYEGKIEIVDDRLQVRSEVEARHVDWHSVLAVKGGSATCSECGGWFEPDFDPIYETRLVRDETGLVIPARCSVVVANRFDAETCENCQAYGDWEY